MINKTIFLANASSFGSTSSSNLQNLLGSATGSGSDIPYTLCPYLSESYSFLACALWCDLREISLGETCTGKSRLIFL